MEDASDRKQLSKLISAMNNERQTVISNQTRYQSFKIDATILAANVQQQL